MCTEQHYGENGFKNQIKYVLQQKYQFHRNLKHEMSRFSYTNNAPKPPKY